MNTDPTSARPALLRIRQWYAKMLYIIAAIAIWYFGGGLPPTDFSRGILRSALVFVLFIVAARVFRSTAETDEQPRPWWRMTGRPLAGFVLGSVLAVAVIVLCLNAYGVETMRSLLLYAGEDVFDVVTAVLCAALAVLYFTSSARLRAIARAERREDERKRNP
jgi:hypothetical protein